MVTASLLSSILVALAVSLLVSVHAFVRDKATTGNPVGGAKEEARSALGRRVVELPIFGLWVFAYGGIAIAFACHRSVQPDPGYLDQTDLFSLNYGVPVVDPSTFNRPLSEAFTNIIGITAMNVARVAWFACCVTSCIHLAQQRRCDLQCIRCIICLLLSIGSVGLTAKMFIWYTAGAPVVVVEYVVLASLMLVASLLSLGEGAPQSFCALPSDSPSASAYVGVRHPDSNPDFLNSRVIKPC